MTKLLRIDTSARPGSIDPYAGGSHSRRLASIVVDRLSRQYDSLLVESRDLSASPVGHIRNATIEGYYTPPEVMTDRLIEATAQSDALIAELEAANILVLSAPIYNFSIPSALKAWIDQVVRIGRTFAYEEGAFRGLLANKQAHLCLAYGAPGYLDDGPLSHMDHMRPYLEMILRFIGISDISVHAIEATTADADVVRAQWDKLDRTLNDRIAA